MPTFTLAQLKNKHPEIVSKRLLSQEDIKSEVETRKLTEGNIFETGERKGFLEKLGGAGEFITSIIGGKELAKGMASVEAARDITPEFSEQARKTEDLQKQLLSRIREKKTSGEDTTRLESALKKSQNLIAIIQDVQSDLEGSMPTSKQVLGSSARLAGTLGAGAVTRGASKMFALGRSTTFFGGALKGAGAGAVSGAGISALQAAGISAEGNKEFSEIATDALIGAGIGVVLGAPIGAVTGGITGFRQGAKIAAEKFPSELASPKETNSVKVDAIRQGRFMDPGFFEKADLEHSKRTMKLGEAIKDVVDPQAPVGKNIENIAKKVSEINQGVKSYVAANKIPFNSNQLKTRLNSGKNELELVFAAESSAEKTYDKVVDVFMDTIVKKDTEGLFGARQGFDKIPAVKKLLETSPLGENARREIVLMVRRKANEYVADLLPKGNQYREQLKLESYMIEAIKNIAEKTAPILGMNKLQLLAKDYPVIFGVIGGTVGGIFGSILTLGGLARGRALIGSSD